MFSGIIDDAKRFNSINYNQSNFKAFFLRNNHFEGKIAFALKAASTRCSIYDAQALLLLSLPCSSHPRRNLRKFDEKRSVCCLYNSNFSFLYESTLIESEIIASHGDRVGALLRNQYANDDGGDFRVIWMGKALRMCFQHSFNSSLNTI